MGVIGEKGGYLTHLSVIKPLERFMALYVGQPAPDICLESHLGHPIRISDFRHQKNIVLAFFPLAWTPV
jgi:hypothetical protein